MKHYVNTVQSCGYVKRMEKYGWLKLRFHCTWGDINVDIRNIWSNGGEELIWNAGADSYEVQE
jgi:hypothetical protein